RGARRLRVEVGDVAAHLAGRPETYDAVDLLDAPDWLQGDALERLFRRAARGLAPGGRLLLRSVGSHTLAAAARATTGSLRSHISLNAPTISRARPASCANVLPRGVPTRAGFMRRRMTPSR